MATVSKKVGENKCTGTHTSTFHFPFDWFRRQDSHPAVCLTKLPSDMTPVTRPMGGGEDGGFNGLRLSTTRALLMRSLQDRKGYPFPQLGLSYNLMGTIPLHLLLSLKLCSRPLLSMSSVCWTLTLSGTVDFNTAWKKLLHKPGLITGLLPQATNA